MSWCTRLARWLAPGEFAAHKALRDQFGAERTNMALRIDLAERVSHNFQNSASSANAQYERLYALVFDRLSPVERKRLSLDVGLPVHAHGIPVGTEAPDLSGESLLALVRACDAVRDFKGQPTHRSLILSYDVIEQIEERAMEWTALEASQ